MACTTTSAVFSFFLLDHYSRNRRRYDYISSCEQQKPHYTISSRSESSSYEETHHSININDKSSSITPQFQNYSYHPYQSMPAGKIASVSSVYGFHDTKKNKSTDLKVGVCVAQNGRSYQEDRWVALLGRPYQDEPKSSFITFVKWRWQWFNDKVNKVSWFSKQEKSLPETYVNDNKDDEVATIFPPDNIAIFAVFDGHGGDECSEYANTYFHSILELELDKINQEQNQGNHDRKDSKQSTTISLLEKTLLRLDQSFIRFQRQQTGIPQSATNSLNYGGSTAIVVAICSDRNEITCSNVGDSRAILIRNIIDDKNSRNETIYTTSDHILPLSSDHSPKSRPDEVSRIINLGGEVKNNPMEHAIALTLGVQLTPRVYHKNGIGGLNMTRALGDDYLKPLIIPNPESIQIEMDPQKDLFVVLATDGVWDVLSNEEVGNLVLKLHHDLGHKLDSLDLVKRCALMLVQKAQQKGSQDNITCMVIQLPSPPIKK